MVIMIDFDGTLTVENIGDIIDEKGLKWNDYASMKDEISKFTPKKGIDILKKYNIKPVITTGRQEPLRDVSELWLFNNNVSYSELVMISPTAYTDKFDWDKYVDFKVEEHLKRDVDFSLDDNKRLVSILRQHDIPAFVVENDFEETFKLAVKTIYGRTS